MAAETGRDLQSHTVSGSRGALIWYNFLYVNPAELVDPHDTG